MKSDRIVVLDRDGVLNEMVVDAEHGTIDSPLHPTQVKLLPGAALALRKINLAGYEIAIATNQPAAAKGKTSRQNLEDVHRLVVDLAQSEGGRILVSKVCWHRAEDDCTCRKPGTKMLQEIFQQLPSLRLSLSWMAGDGVSDIEAGQRFGLKTAFIAPKKTAFWPIFQNESLRPSFWGDSILEFSEFLKEERR